MSLIAASPYILVEICFSYEEPDIVAHHFFNPKSLVAPLNSLHFLVKPLTMLVTDVTKILRMKSSQLLAPGVYRIPCVCGSVYIDEIKRSVSVGVSEHERCTRLRQITSSALAEHRHNNSSRPNKNHLPGITLLSS